MLGSTDNENVHLKWPAMFYFSSKVDKEEILQISAQLLCRDSVLMGLSAERIISNRGFRRVLGVDYDFQGGLIVRPA
jgi:hypothetical protein